MWNRWEKKEINELKISNQLKSCIILSDGPDHHLLVILKIKIRSSKKCNPEDQRSLKHCDLEDQDHFTFSTQREVVVMMRGRGKL